MEGKVGYREKCAHTQRESIFFFFSGERVEHNLSHQPRVLTITGLQVFD